MGRGRGAGLVLAIAGWALFAPAGEAADDAHRRARMLEVIQEHAGQGGSAALASAISPAVIAAMSRVPRHDFVPGALRAHAYEDRPLPIGYGQTISQPYIVALMTDLLKPARGQSMLEIGTGSGYQAAVLAELGIETYTMEIVPALGEAAAARLDRLGYGRARVRVGDGYHGWPEHAPFDGIIVTAAAGHVPPPLVAQLKPGGRMVIPIGPAFMVQRLVLVTKAADGTLGIRQLLPVRFVPLTGRH